MSEGGEAWVDLLSILDKELADILGLLLRIDAREARAFKIVCRGIQSVDNAFFDRRLIDFRRNVRNFEEGSDRPTAS
jgi:hypothetical protein